MRGDLVEALRGVDTVIYDTHFTPEEYQEFPHWGHSTPDHALEICLESGVGRLVLYHHAPGHDDNTMDAIAAKYREIGKQHGIEVVAAKEGMRLGIGIQTNPGLMPL